MKKMEDDQRLEKICRLIRYDIITATTKAGSGHPSSSLSAVELMAALFFAGPPAGGFFRFDFKNPQNPLNDRLIFSKGHATPLLYALYHAAGALSYDELLTLRNFDSRLEGHPTPRFPYIDVATGSLGQGLSVGVGMALAIRNKKLGKNLSSNIQFPNPLPKLSFLSKIYVLLGDSEMAEGQIWEAMEIASHYKLNNLIAILDVNRLGQRGKTMLGWDLKTYARRAESFGWNPVVIDDGHNLKKIIKAYNSLNSATEKPSFFIAKTTKGKGISFLENRDGWHGKVIPKDRLQEALNELGKVDLDARGKIDLPNNNLILNNKIQNNNLRSKIYDLGSSCSTREAYGDALVNLGENNKNIVVLDAETSNSTYADKFAKKYPDRFFEMFIAEQNMISTALGLSKQNLVPFVSTFGAFLTRGFDQIRMSQYSNPNLKICGSHCGVSIGADGPSQMGLEDMAMFRSLLNSVVFYPSDAVSTFELTRIMAENNGLFYLRTTREKTSIIYSSDEEFKIGGSKILKNPEKPQALVIAAGITVHEALKAHNQLEKEGIGITVLDLYTIKPIDIATIKSLITTHSSLMTNIIVVEDHYPAGGLGEAVLSALSNIKDLGSKINFTHLCVKKLPRSGNPEELLTYEEIDAKAIIKAARLTAE